jgi:hypothetical protein
LQARDSEVHPGGKLASRLLQHRVALVDPHERSPWMMLEDAPRSLPRPSTELENSSSRNAARRLGDRVLELVETLDVCSDHLEVAVGTEMELAHRTSPGSSESPSIVHGAIVAPTKKWPEVADFGPESNSAATYSPGRLPSEYHRRWRA